MEIKEKAKQLCVNDTVYFGHYVLSNFAYPRDVIVRKPIPWIVLKKEGSRMLLLSKECLAWEFYDGSASLLEAAHDVTWETCTIREWLNQEWFSEYFTEEESRLILETELVTEDNAEYGTAGGNPTKDRLFLLAADELTDSADMRAELFLAREASDEEGIELSVWPCLWWLRTPGGKQNRAAVVDRKGKVDLYGIRVDADEIGIRPAMWIDTAL